MNDMTPNRYCPADLLQKLDQDIHPWLLSEREGGNKTTLSYVKVDILTDTLNKLFGPLGWGVEAEIQKMEDFQYEKPGYQGGAPTEMYVFQVISQVKLTIKPQTEAGSPTIFVQSGIGYGEVKINAHRKDAVGMAVKGAESDGLKRCCNFLGRALGMFLVGGKQDPVVYAHNGNKNKAVVNRAMRDREDHEDRQRSRQDRGGRDADDRPDVRDQDDGRRTESRSRDEQPRDNRTRDERPRDEQPRDNRARDERPRDEQPRESRSRDERPRDDRQEAPGRERPEGSRDRDEPAARQEGSTASADTRADEPAATEGREAQPSRRRSSARTGGDAPAKGDEADAPKPEVKTQRKANTNYDLRKVPVTRENQKDFGATFIKQMEGMRQPEDQVQMVKNYAQRINELDPDIRALVVERLRERDIDVTLLD